MTQTPPPNSLDHRLVDIPWPNTNGSAQSTLFSRPHELSSLTGTE